MATLEFLQQEWINDGNFMSLGVLRADGATFTVPQEPVRRRIHGIETFNVVRGGEYLLHARSVCLAMAGEPRPFLTLTVCPSDAALGT
jgi:hypothetical protein